MKDEYKILIGAVVVILIVLVGVFALSGSNNPQPTATPTVIPVTATPTATPGGNGGTPSANPTVAPTVAPTAVPTATPSTEPASGVKQTEFGYWITYPPLGPENWSSPKPQPNQAPNNTIYFSPTSASLNIGYLYSDSDYYTIDAVLYRKGDLNDATTVTVHTDTSDNLWLDSLGSYYYVDNVDYINNTDFTVTFAPGESSHVLTIIVEGAEEIKPQSISAMAASYLGTIQLNIVGVDDGYTYGYQDQYTLTVNNNGEQPLYVTFDYSGGYFFASSFLTSIKPLDTVNWDYGDSIVSVSDDGTWASVDIRLSRYTGNHVPYTTGDLDVPVYVDSVTDPSLTTYTLVQPHFSDGSSTADLIVKIPMSYINQDKWCFMYLDINGGDYMIWPSGGYSLEVNSD